MNRIKAAAILCILCVSAVIYGQQPAADLRTARRLGAAHYEEGNYKAAVEQFRAVLRAQPRAGTFADHLNLGLALIGLPDEAGALAELETARQMQPNSPAPLYALGILHKRQGRFREALDYLERAQKAGANDMAALFNTGAVLMSLGRNEEALAALQRVLDRGVDFGPGWYLAAEYRISRILQRTGRAEEAAAALKRWEARRRSMKDPTETAAMLELGPLASPQLPPEPAAAPRPAAVPTFGSPISAAAQPSPDLQAIQFDFDTDGDLDRLAVPARCGPLKLERNNGSDAFSDVTAASGVASPKPVCAAAHVDLDGDGDPDIVAAGSEGAWLFNNQRGGKFRLESPFGSAAGTSIAVADLDADGAFDVVFGSSARMLVWWNRGAQLAAVEGAREPWTAADVNGDGFDDIAAAGVGRLMFWLNEAGRRFRQVDGPAVSGSISRLRAEYPRDGVLSLIVGTREGAAWKLDRTAPKSHWLRLNLDGVRSNKAGIGAVVEVKAGNFYSRAMVTESPLTIETGSLTRVDVVRVTWPNGIVQNVIETPTDRALRVAEQDRLASSCPLLYLWDGRQFRFFAEVLSSTPLGEPDGRGGFILPGLRENVFLPAQKIIARNGRYVFQLTEELREAVYLDRARLVALDYPTGTRVFVDEAYRGAPAPISEVTLRHPVTITAHRESTPPADLLPGLTDRHAVSFKLPPEVEVDFLVLRGWTYWMDSNIATAAAQNPARPVQPPALEARQTDGNWKTVIADLGLPAGAGRYVLADLRGLKRQTGMSIQLRIVTNLRVSWEEILGGKVEGTPKRSAALPFSAGLHHRGFSLPVISPARAEPDFYDYSRLMPHAPWNALPGRYTRYGDVRPLLEAEDDRLVIFGAGDELTLEFPATGYPPLPDGWRRDFVLELSGWAKAGETNTAGSDGVEPLPYRAMKRYPYGATQQKTWQRRWLTRRSMPHLPPLAPAH